MCGICGTFRLDGSRADLDAVMAMRAGLEHRGPDDSGEWNNGPAAFGFRRLSILDLEGGHQPMLSSDGSLAVVFNGEIYNHPSLKLELEAGGVRFRTRSDTETILHLYERFGEDAFRRLNGMFAVGLWDGRRRKLILVRDHLGVKPLYYSLAGSRLFFSSELRSLMAADVGGRIDPGAAAEYLMNGFVAAPRTILAGVMKLPPGHWLKVDADGLRLEKYWDIVPDGAAGEMSLDESETEIERRLAESVRAQLLSDVPVGAFLSGGIDSSLITALMVRAAGKKVSTFSIGFSGAQRGLDESRYAKRVSEHLGTDHHELVLPDSVLDRIEDLVPSMDEPIADSAILPTFLLARHARKSVKVVLTGEGADELFGGYNRYKAAYLSERLMEMPALGRKLAAPLARRAGRGRLFSGMPVKKMSDWSRLNAHSAERDLGAFCPPEIVSAGAEYAAEIERRDGSPLTLNGALRQDLRTILADCLLMKVDKATMRASLESRVPFLDKELVEFALGLPANVKVRRLKGKYVLRKLAAKYLPKDIVWRRKHGFVVPWEQWIERPENHFVDEVVSDAKLSDSGVIDMKALRLARQALIRGDQTIDRGLFFRIVVLGLWMRL